jgi:hypothetical protein
MTSYVCKKILTIGKVWEVELLIVAVLNFLQAENIGVQSLEFQLQLWLYRWYNTHFKRSDFLC